MLWSRFLLAAGAAVVVQGCGAATVSVSSGLPIPDSIHGYKPRPADANRVRFLGHLDGALGYQASDLPIAFGMWAAGQLAVVEVLRVNAWSLSAAVGPGALLALGPWTSAGIRVRGTTGPGVLWHRMHLDDRIEKTTVSLGWRSAVGCSVGVFRRFSLGVQVGREDYAAPFYNEIWFNQQLKGTGLWTATVLVSWDRSAPPP